MSRLETLLKIKAIEEAENKALIAETNRLAHIMIKEHFAFKEVIKRKNAEILALKKGVEDTQKEILRARSLLEKTEKKSKKHRKRRKDDQTRSNVGMSTTACEESTSSSGFEGSTSSYCLSEKEARLISLLSIFLNYLPFGSNIEHICSFINQNIDPNITAEDVEKFLEKHTIFKQNATGIPSLIKNWSINL